jgi:hypothetical protein
MAKVSIAKLLKTKNRLASEISRVKSKIAEHNVFSYDEDETNVSPKMDVVALVEELGTLTNKLVLVKSAINSANVKSSDKIFRLAELKGHISLLEKLNTNEGREKNYYGNSSVTIRKAQINTTQKDQMLKDLIKQCENIQDELDEFNASHRVEIPDDVLL